MKNNVMRDVWKLRSYYFVLFAGVGSFLPFIYLHMADLGFSNAQIGILGAIGPAVMVFVQPFWGWMTDRTGRPDLIAFIMNLGVAVWVGVLLRANTFVAIVIYMILYNIFYSSLAPIFDSVTIETVNGSDGKVGYGNVRWLGSLGFALMVIAAGRVIEWTSIPTVLWVYVVSSVLLALMVLKMPRKAREQGARVRVRIWPLFKNRELMVFLVAASLVIGSNAINYTFFPFLMKDLGGGEGILGLAMMVSAFAEIPFFWISAKLIRRFKIPYMLFIAFAVTALRWWLNSIATSPYHLLGFQLMHSLTFGLLYSSAVVYVDRLVPERLRASGQTLFWAATYGLGNVIGNLVGGWVYQYSSVQSLFALASVAAAAGTLVMLGGIVAPMVREAWATTK